VSQYAVEDSASLLGNVRFAAGIFPFNAGRLSHENPTPLPPIHTHVPPLVADRIIVAAVTRALTDGPIRPEQQRLDAGCRRVLALFGKGPLANVFGGSVRGDVSAAGSNSTKATSETGVGVGATTALNNKAQQQGLQAPITGLTLDEFRMGFVRAPDVVHAIFSESGTAAAISPTRGIAAPKSAKARTSSPARMAGPPSAVKNKRMSEADVIRQPSREVDTMKPHRSVSGPPSVSGRHGAAPSPDPTRFVSAPSTSADLLADKGSSAVQDAARTEERLHSGHVSASASSAQTRDGAAGEATDDSSSGAPDNLDKDAVVGSTTATTNSSSSGGGGRSSPTVIDSVAIGEELEKLSAMVRTYEKSLAVSEGLRDDAAMREELGMLKIWRHVLLVAVRSASGAAPHATAPYPAASTASGSPTPTTSPTTTTAGSSAPQASATLATTTDNTSSSTRRPDVDESRDRASIAGTPSLTPPPSDELIAELRDALNVEISMRGFFDTRIAQEIEAISPLDKQGRKKEVVVYNADRKMEALLEAQDVERRRRREWNKAWYRNKLENIIAAANAANDCEPPPSPDNIPDRRASIATSDSGSRSSGRSSDKPQRRHSKSPLLQWALSTVTSSLSDGESDATSWTKWANQAGAGWLRVRRERTEGPLPIHQQEMIVTRLTALRKLPQAARVKLRPCGRMCVLIRPGTTSMMDRCEHTSDRNIAKFLESMDYCVQANNTSANPSSSTSAASAETLSKVPTPSSPSRRVSNTGVKAPRASSSSSSSRGGGGGGGGGGGQSSRGGAGDASGRPTVSKPRPAVVGFTDV
jgi:hypothetical protein